MRRLQPVVTLIVSVVLIAVIIGGAVFLWRLYSHRTSVDIRETGGIILTYEIDRDEPLDTATMEQMLEKTKRRFAGRMGYVTVLPAGDRRVELQVPRLKKLDFAAEVESVQSIMV